MKRRRCKSNCAIEDKSNSSSEVLVQRMKLLEDRLNLVGLPRVNGAVFNERMHQYKDECLEATCSDVYRQIAE